MSAEIEIVRKDGYILSALTGESGSLDELVDYMDRVVAECRSAGTALVLMDHRNFMFELNTVDSYEFGIKLLDRMPLGAVSRVALVVPTSRLDSARFYETVSAGQAVTVKVFDRVRMALVWLRG